MVRGFWGLCSANNGDEYRVPASCGGFQPVLMMKPAQHWLSDDSKADRQAMTVCRLAGLLTLRIWDARSQARMWASVVVVSHPFRHDGPEMSFIQQDQPIQSLATHAADQPLAKCVCLWCPHWCLENPQTHGRRGGIDALRIDAVTVVNKPSMALVA